MADVQTSFFAQHIVLSGDNPYKQLSCTQGKPLLRENPN